MAAVAIATPVSSLPASGKEVPSGVTELNELPAQLPPRSLADGIRLLRASAALCDIWLVAGNQEFPAHQAMLCAMSPAFHTFILEAAQVKQEEVKEEVKQEVKEEIEVKKEEDGVKQVKEELSDDKSQPAPQPAPQPASRPAPQLKLQMSGVSHAESVNIMLDYVYQVGTGAPWEYNPPSLEVNTEILQLARQFGLKQLHEHAARWLVTNLTTHNLVQRLVICEEFKLNKLRDRLIEQLTANPAELSTVCRSGEILSHPKILQDLLVQVSSFLGMVEQDTSRKREAPEDSSEVVAETEVFQPEVEKPAKATTKAVPEKPLKKKRTA